MRKDQPARSKWTWIIGIPVILFAVLVSMPRRAAQPLTPAALTAAPSPEVNRQDVIDRITLDARRYTGVSGDPLTASFKIKNANSFPIKDFTILFTFHGNSGTLISSRKKTFYEIVPAKGAKAIKGARLGFMPDGGVSVGWELVDYGVP